MHTPVSTQLSYRYLSLPYSITLKSNLIVSGIQWLIKCPFCPLIVEAKFGKHDVVVVGIYRPPKSIGEQYYLRLEEELNDICTFASLQKQFVIVLGDLNLDRLRPERREGKILLDLEDIHGYSCLIDQPTRITDHSQTLLDIILTNKPYLFQGCDVFNPELSDHALVYGILKIKATYHPRKIITFRNLKSINEEERKYDLHIAPWHVGDIFDSIEDKCSFWDSLLNYVLDEHAPFKKLRVRAQDVPYMTSEWKRAIRNKRKFSKQFSKNRTQLNLELKNKWCNEATKLRRKSVKSYWQLVFWGS